MSGSWPFVEETIAARLALIAPLVHRRHAVLPDFRLLPLQAARVDAPLDGDPQDWQVIPPQSYWGHADLNFILKTTFQVPEGWHADRIALHLPLGVLGDIFNHPEALVHVEGVPIGSADRYHHTLGLSADMADGRPHDLTLHGWTGLAGWPPVPGCKAKLFMGIPAVVERCETLLAFHRLAAAALDTVRTLGGDASARPGLLSALAAAMQTLDTRAPLGDALYATAPDALARLQADIAAVGAADTITLHGIGHAHMDIAYLWPISQIRLKNARTYSNVLRLMAQDPDYRFSHSQPQLYAYTQQDYPDLFAQIRTRVDEGRWEVMGGMWVEPDLNLPGPEALIRQLTLGRGYFRETFGDVETPVLWLPDTFGFPAQVPQLMKLAGLDWFVTNKLNWNQCTPVPSSTHHWEGLDGSRVIAHVLTTPRDVQYLPFPTNYKSDLSAAEVHGTATRATTPVGIRDQLICYGYGDGGGGPTEDLLARAQAYASMPGMPTFRHGTVRGFFERIEQNADDLPVWTGEHYMEGHRGTFTSQGWIKRANRKAEWALHEAEALAVLARQTVDLKPAWELLCLNQFHDIITGTSVAEVFADARRDLSRIARLVEDRGAPARAALAGPTWRVANTAPTSGARLAVLPDAAAAEHVQHTDAGQLALFDDLAAYSTVSVCDAVAPAGRVDCRAVGASYVLENDTLRVEVNRHGHVADVRMKATQAPVLCAPGNTLLAFEDRPICWDAWDIDPGYEARGETIKGATTCEIVETGPLRACLRVTTKWRSSTIRQQIRLCAHADRIDFVTDVDWHETHTLLKAAFPTPIVARAASFDIQWGHVMRPTHRDTPFAAARFEVPAHKWAMLEDDHLAVAVLNDCKYGYDVQGGTIRITLIKSATAPDPGADQGRHVFTYALLPFPPDRRDMLDHAAYDLNAPLRAIPPDPAAADARLHGIVRVLNSGVLLETLKPAEDGNGFILRLFEARGQAATVPIAFVRAIHSAVRTTIFEADMCPLLSEGSMLRLNVAPFEIVSLRVVLKDAQVDGGDGDEWRVIAGADINNRRYARVVRMRNAVTGDCR